MKRRTLTITVLSLALTVLFFDTATADRYSSTSYIIDASVMSAVGGAQSSTSYRLTSSGGEAIVGNGLAGSYKLGFGYVSELEKSLLLTVQPSGLVAAYQLDESTGTGTYDSSYYRVTGSLVNAPTWAAGKLGGGVQFNGSTQAINVGNPAHLQLSSKGTLSAWVKTSTATGTQGLVTKASNFWMGLSAGRPAMYDWPTGVTCTDLTTSLADNTWHHMALTLDSGVTDGSTIYVDGIAKKTCTWTPQGQSGAVALASVSTGVSTYSHFLNGTMDHVKIFNRILSPEEIAAERSAQNGGTPSGLTLGTITPNTSNTALADIIVQTDSGGYTLAVNQNNDLTSGAYTIPAISGSIASPASWSEGTTKGLGFTLTATNATAIPGTWSGGSSYAPLPGTATSFYTRTGTQAAVGDYITMRLRADVAASQPTTSGSYSNIMTITGTMTP